MPSNNLRVVDGQGELPLARPPKPEPVALEVIQAQRTFSAAMSLAVNVSGLEEKEIYIPLKIDAGHWTRIMKGDAHFPVDKLNEFCDLVGNEIPLIWWAHSRGKGVHLLKTEAERQLLAEQERSKELELENRVLLKALHGRAV